MLRTCVTITTFKRAWALPYSISSLKEQSIHPDKVVFVLKPSGDKSQEVIENSASGLNYEIIIQNSGNFAKALELGINACRDFDLILFLDDDAIARKDWIERYLRFFERDEKAGGASGIIYKGLLADGKIELVDELFYDYSIARGGIHRKPLPEYEDYCEWISTSGLPGNRRCDGDVLPSVFLTGANMAFRTNAIEGCPIGELFSKSRKCLHNEEMLSYCARKKGFHTYRIGSRETAPVVYHIAGIESLTRGKGFSHRFWITYDFARDFWRLKMLGADVSILHYLIGMLVISRKDPIASIPAVIYAMLG